MFSASICCCSDVSWPKISSPQHRFRRGRTRSQIIFASPNPQTWSGCVAPSSLIPATIPLQLHFPENVSPFLSWWVFAHILVPWAAELKLRASAGLFICFSLHGSQRVKQPSMQVACKVQSSVPSPSLSPQSLSDTSVLWWARPCLSWDASFWSKHFHLFQFSSKSKY